MPIEGITPSTHSDRKSILRLILGKDEVNPLEVISASQLSVEMRLPHSIISYIRLPKTSRFNFLSKRDLIIMHCILEKIPINLPKLMISYMCKASTKTHASLPYVMVLTTLFRAFRVPILEEESKKILFHTDIYNIQTLHKIGFHKVSGA